MLAWKFSIENELPVHYLFLLLNLLVFLIFVKIRYVKKLILWKIIILLVDFFSYNCVEILKFFFVIHYQLALKSITAYLYLKNMSS